MKFVILLLLVLIVAQHQLSVVLTSPTGANDKLVEPVDSVATNANQEQKNFNEFETGTYLNPVILIPGDGGSRLQAKLDRRDVAHHYCERKSNDWFDLWLNLSLLVPFAIDCWVDK